ncbi:hypothetical protein V8G54_027112 [Vigna mungo]|uniref:Uncharacterized protein n=1 Tax=Vigna mungo TaxID=3915 RepID=A0AAQ3N0S3_VIGMU
MQTALWNIYKGKIIPPGVLLVLVNSGDLFLPFVQAFLLLFFFCFQCDPPTVLCPLSLEDPSLTQDVPLFVSLSSKFLSESPPNRFRLFPFLTKFSCPPTTQHTPHAL